MTLRRRDLVALLLAAGTLVAGVVTWVEGEVDLGVVLGTDGTGTVQVAEVAPGSIAAREGFAPGQLVTGLTTTDGRQVEDGQTAHLPPEYGSGNELLRLPAEPLPEWEIGHLDTGELYESFGSVDGIPTIYPAQHGLDRGVWLARLGSAMPLMLMGIGLGAGVGYAIWRGWFGQGWRGEAIPFGAAVAIPLLATPLLYAGAWLGMVSAFGLAATGSLPAARSIAERHPVERWPAVLVGVAVIIVATVWLTAGRAATDSGAPFGDSLSSLLLVAAVTLAPALVVALAVERSASDRAEMTMLALGPGAAATVLVTTFANPLAIFGWLAAGLGWPRAVSAMQALARRTRMTESPGGALPGRPTLDAADGADGWRVLGLRLRDAGALAVAGVTGIGALVACCDTWSVILGAGLGAAVGLALRRGFLAEGWRDAAVPLGCATATPVLAVGLASGGGGTSGAAALVLATLSALPVAFLLAARHPDPTWRRLLAYVTAGLAALAIIANLQFAVADAWYASGSAERYLLMGLVSLVPGLSVSFSRAPTTGTRTTYRLDTLVVALTPGAAMTVMVPAFGPMLFAAWLILVVAWRGLTISPLLGLAARTQRQRDLAVAAVEAERARLAADLHDDALQELSALVRRLDASGDAEGAELARGVAERLRTITSDLRLPLLDDLGAGPALEWLVGRVRPLADGAVVLERADGERPPAGVELAVFRIAQEALANAIKHGKPPIVVRYRVAEDGGVSLSIDDAGPGIEPGAAEDALQAGRLGLANMQQRAQQIGALLDIRRWPSGGTHVALEWRPR